MSIAVATIKDVDEHGPIIEWHQHWAELKGRTLYTHLTQPAQAVDAGAIREVVDRLTDGNPYGMSRLYPTEREAIEAVRASIAKGEKA